MRRLAFLYIFLSTISFGQQRTDSLERKILSAPSDSVKVVLLNEWVASIRENDNKKSLELSLEAEELAQKANFKMGLAVALENLGWLNYRRDNYLEAINFSTRAFEINREIGNKKGMASCMNNIAAVYFERNQYHDAIKGFKEAFQLGKQASEPSIMGRSYNNIAFCLVQLNKLDSAEYFSDVAIRFSTLAKDDFRVAFGYRTMGDIYMARKNYDEALRFYQKALSVDNGKNSFMQASTLYRVGNAYLKMENFEKAEQFLVANLSIAKSHIYRSELATNYKLLSELYILKRNPPKALDFFNKYVLMNDTLSNEKTNRQTSLIQAKYEDERNKAKIELMQREAELRDKDIIVQRTLIYVFAGALVIVGISTFGLVRINRNRKAANFLLKERNKLIDNQKLQLIGLNATKDKIFSIIGHDLRGPLASLRGLIELASNERLSREEFIEMSKTLKLNLDYVNEDMDNLLNWARTQLKGFEPVLTHVDLRNSVEEKIHLLSEPAKSKAITLQSDIQEGTLVLADKNNLDIILRNLMGNAIKFSLPAGTVRINAVFQNGMCQVSVTDRGVGLAKDEIEKLFRPESHFSKQGTNREKGLGIGLLLVKEFVEKNGGTISVKSEIGKGSTFTFTMKAVAFPDLSQKKEMVESFNH